MDSDKRRKYYCHIFWEHGTNEKTDKIAYCVPHSWQLRWWHHYLRQRIGDIFVFVLRFEEEGLKKNKPPVEAIARPVAWCEAILKGVWQNVVKMSHSHCAPVLYYLYQQWLKPACTFTTKVITQTRTAVRGGWGWTQSTMSGWGFAEATEDLKTWQKTYRKMQIKTSRESVS